MKIIHLNQTLELKRKDCITRTIGNLVVAGTLSRSETDLIKETEKNLSFLSDSDLIATMVESHNMRENAIENGYAVYNLDLHRN